MFGENMKNLQSESIKKFYAVNPKFSIFFDDGIYCSIFLERGGECTRKRNKLRSSQREITKDFNVLSSTLSSELVRFCVCR